MFWGHPGEESNAPLSAVTVWLLFPLLVHTTASPAWIVTLLGEKL